MAVVYVNSDCVHATRHAYQFEEKSATVSNKIMHIHTSSSCISMTKTLYRNHLFAMVDTVSMALLKLLQTLLSLCEYCLRIGNLLRFKWPIDQNSSADNRPKKWTICKRAIWKEAVIWKSETGVNDAYLL